MAARKAVSVILPCHCRSLDTKKGSLAGEEVHATFWLLPNIRTSTACCICKGDTSVKISPMTKWVETLLRSSRFVPIVQIWNNSASPCAVLLHPSDGLLPHGPRPNGVRLPSCDEPHRSPERSAGVPPRTAWVIAMIKRPRLEEPAGVSKMPYIKNSKVNPAFALAPFNPAFGECACTGSSANIWSGVTWCDMCLLINHFPSVMWQDVGASTLVRRSSSGSYHRCHDLL